MTIVSAATDPGADVDVVAVPVFSPFEPARPVAGLDGEHCRRLGFEAKPGTSLLLGAGTPGTVQVLVGLGERDRLDAERLRLAGAAAARAARRARTLAFDLTGVAAAGLDPAEAAAAAAEGALLAGYRYTRYKTAEEPEPELERLELVGADLDAAASAAARAQVVAEAVALARDLGNTPAGDLPPRRFAELATEIAARERLSLSVLDEEAIAAERLGGILAVAAGSAEPPRLVKLEYLPDAPAGPGPVATVALVGKGITFDSGGLSLKPPASMMTMKMDMSGAAAVLATLAACRRLQVGVRVVGIMPLTENLPGGRATKPGDVLRARNGKTIEVLNTDAEGRLVLADALSLAAEEEPDAIVDLATLTGACVVALGDAIAGVMGNDDRLVDAVLGASARAGEPMWHLPLPAGYRSQIDSDVADMKNIGAPGKAGALAGGLLLEEFVGSVPWVHLDIAGPAWSEEDAGYRRKGSTGYAVRTLLELVTRYERLGGTVEGPARGTEVLR